MIAKEKIFLTALFMLLAGDSGIAKMEMVPVHQKCLASCTVCSAVLIISCISKT